MPSDCSASAADVAWVQAAIAQRRAELAADTAALEEVLAEGAAAGVHPFNQPGITAGVKVWGCLWCAVYITAAAAAEAQCHWP